MPPPNWTRPARLLAALLTVLAGFAYPLRAPPGAGFPGAPVHCGAMPPRKHAPPACPDHPPHCLFCLTGAFSGAPAAALRVPLVRGAALPVPPPAPHAAYACPAHADARAPPLPLA